MMHGSWDIECNRQNFLSFCPLPLTTWTINILKNEKNIWRYHHFTYLYHKWQSYEVWFLSYQAWQTRIFLSLWTIFCTNNPKNKNFEKLTKRPGNIIILHKCTKNHDHMLYCSLDMTRNRFNYFSFWASFYFFTSLTAQKIKIFLKMKKMPGNIIILHTCTKNYGQMMYGSWDMVCNRWSDRSTEKDIQRWVPHLKIIVH